MGITTLSPLPMSRVIQQLVHGQECATQLQILFQQYKSPEEVADAAEELVQKVMRCFNETISVLSCCSPAACCRSEDSLESTKRPAPAKDRRGCYKRKRGSQTRTLVSATMEDGHAWRKYGQKEILNSKYPRSYFRCTRKYDQGCKATKQVQRVEDDSQMFQITYIGTHTCSASFRSLQIITNSAGSYYESKIPTKQHHHLTTPTPPLVKKEPKEETTPSDLESNSIIMWKDIMSEPDIGMASSNYVYACDEITCHSLELDFDQIKPVSVEFDSEFHFDE